MRVASYAKVATAAEYPAPFEPKKMEWDKPIPYIFLAFDTAPISYRRYIETPLQEKQKDSLKMNYWYKLN